ncbi:hypothetical protein BDAP_001374 [Binucleata daphniae]
MVHWLLHHVFVHLILLLKGDMAEMNQENVKSVKSVISSKKAAENKSLKNGSIKENVTAISSKMSDKKSLTPQNKTEFHQKSFNSLKPIIGTEIVEVEIDDVKFYMEHSDEYRIQKGEKLIPYIIRMNERYKTKVETRIKHRKIKKGMLIFFVVFGSIIAIVMIIWMISVLKGKNQG